MVGGRGGRVVVVGGWLDGRVVVVIVVIVVVVVVGRGRGGRGGLMAGWGGLLVHGGTAMRPCN